MALNNTYTSKYPTIIVDTRANSVNESLQKKMTIEEYYDLMHHTHNISQLTSDEGAMSYNEMQNAINSLTKTIGELKIIIEAQQSTIIELKQTVQTLSDEVANTPTVSDWDVETPGNQDINGNDLGTFMGLTMTEIE